MKLREEQTILRIVSKIMLPFILLYALYVQFHGDYGPGGGFQAGVIFATGFVLYGLVFGMKAAKQVLSPAWLQLLMPLGVLLYAGVGMFSLLSGGEFLNYNLLDSGHPVHGQHLGILLVELGVGITVAAVLVAVFYAFSSRGRD